MKVEALKRGQLWKPDIIAEDAQSKKLLETVYKVAQTDSTVLISGETGTGKEEIAKLLHQNSRRRKEAFVRINCGAISPELIESELFGYEKAPLQAPTAVENWACLRSRTREPCFWTRLGNCRCRCRSSCCAFCRSGRSCG